VVDDSTITMPAPAGDLGASHGIIVSSDYGASAPRAYGYLLEGLLAADGQGGLVGSLYLVNPTNGNMTELRELQHAYTGLAFAADGALYGVEANPENDDARRL